MMSLKAEIPETRRRVESAKIRARLGIVLWRNYTVIVVLLKQVVESRR